MSSSEIAFGDHKCGWVLTMRLWKRFTYAAIAGAGLLVGIVGYFEFTFPWELSWVKSATSLTLREPEETLTGVELQKFLEDFECDNIPKIGYYTLRKQTGHIQINDEVYSIELILDKWHGEVLSVRRRWKTVQVDRAWKNIKPRSDERRGT